jgi:hypothetical protein
MMELACASVPEPLVNIAHHRRFTAEFGKLQKLSRSIMLLPGSERGNVQNITTVYVVAIGEHAQRSV